MTVFETLGFLLTVAAAFAYVNFRWIRLPAAIGLMATSLVMSLLLIAVDKTGLWPLHASAATMLERVSFGDTVLHGMLGALLFAGALHVDVNELRRERGAILLLAFGSTIISTVVIGGLSYVTLNAIGVRLSFGYCLLFGTVVAPTDPVGVLGILKQARIAKSLEVQIAGESLFNDGIGVVLFLSVLGFVTRPGEIAFGHVARIFFQEVLGGILFGGVTGYIAYRLLKSIDHYQTELLITLALVLGGYALAERLGFSAALAAVVSGLFIGNQGRHLAMSDVTRDHLDKFWSLIDEILNAVLFVLIGFELILLSFTRDTMLAGMLAIPIALFARFVSIAGPVTLLGRWLKFAPGSIPILTWGGLRGGISVALALSIPLAPERNLVVTMTYFAVVFSVLVQGLTLARVARRFSPK